MELIHKPYRYLRKSAGDWFLKAPVSYSHYEATANLPQGSLPTRQGCDFHKNILSLKQKDTLIALSVLLRILLLLIKIYYENRHAGLTGQETPVSWGESRQRKVCGNIASPMKQALLGASLTLALVLVVLVSFVEGRASAPKPFTLADLPATPFPVQESVVTDAKKGTVAVVQYGGSFQKGTLILDRAHMQLVKPQ